MTVTNDKWLTLHRVDILDSSLQKFLIENLWKFMQHEWIKEGKFLFYLISRKPAIVIARLG